MEQINNITKERKWKQITELDRYKIEALLQHSQVNGHSF